jgi:translation initiation factor IF-3
MARPPVCKLMDYGKFKYESALKARESRKNQAQTIIKEIKLRPKIDPHDYGTKKGHVERFLKAGDKVKVTIMFRGREQSRPELGFKLLQRLASDVDEFGFVESSPKQDGRNMIMVIGPHKRKADAMAAAKAERASRSNARGPAGHDDDDQLDFSLEALAESAVEAAADEDAAAAPVQAAPVQAAPAQAAPVQAAPVRPAAAQTAPAESSPAAAKPAPARPAPARSTPARPASEAGAAAAPRPSAPPRPQPRPGAGAGSAAPKPTAPRTAASPAPRPGAPASGAAPKPSAPRSAAATTARPGPARRTADGPVPSPRGVDADAAKEPAPAESGDSDS